MMPFELSSPLAQAGCGFAVICLCMLLLWLASLRQHNVSMVDAFWGPGFFILGVSEAAVVGRFDERTLLVLGLVLVWGLRLGVHLHVRGHGAPEDRRYAAMRERRGPAFAWQSLFIVFLLQAVLLFVIAAPIQTVTLGPERALDSFAFFGAGLSALGIALEALADWQLTRFRKQPDSGQRVLDRGLFRYSRHPNYFGNFCIFWGLWLIALPLPYGGLSALGPLLLSGMLLRVSGVTLLEKDIAERRPGYRSYVERTPAFFPWFPKDDSSGTQAGPSQKRAPHTTS